MKMKSKMLYVPMVIAVMAALVVTNSGLTSTAKPKPTTTTAKPWTRTTGPPGLNLNGKMFTLSFNGGGISFYPPYFSPIPSSWPSTTPYPTRRYTSHPYFTTTRHYTTTAKPTTRPRPTTTRPRPTTTYPPWTTAPPTRGVSVCLRYLTDYQQTSNPSIFTLSPSSRTPLSLGVSYGSYKLSFDGYSYYNLYLKPDIRFWSNIGPDIWTRVCLTMDSMKNVAQMFSGSSISIRKMLPIRYVWSGEPVIDFSGFDGQVTDVQMWDYPLRYKEIFNYMTSGVYAPYRGSVLTWSSISYSPRGNALLEDVYDWQAKQPISSRGRGRQPKGEKETREFFDVGERKERKREQL